ncbi:hypothetical protein [Nitrosomonas supralitoralis]|uniref:hypothetical protein n=1 Tax=Nitrosomonas supralitoralis TaxID=2116706 RepID=UPI0015588374|nr:hypothetical protein [Nitrosomonas supralitoralis]
MDRLAVLAASIAETKEIDKLSEMAGIENNSVVPVSTTMSNQPFRESENDEKN